MNAVIIETERLYLRQHKPLDIDDYCAMEMDAGVRLFVGGYPRTREDAEKRFSGNLQQINDGLGMWAAVLKDSDEYVGRCGIYPHFNDTGKLTDGECSIGLYIATKHWNKGLATEAGIALIQMAFEILGLDRIVTLVDARNDASIKVMQKLGFFLEKTEEGQWRTFHTFVLQNRLFPAR